MAKTPSSTSTTANGKDQGLRPERVARRLDRVPRGAFPADARGLVDGGGPAEGSGPAGGEERTGRAEPRAGWPVDAGRFEAGGTSPGTKRSARAMEVPGRSTGGTNTSGRG
ncbi:hypothetical protein ACGFIK_16585 [Micromonospora sp. NPDC048871]|uniref:hypothetical protein n=1 Tax=unclassified Micromonospora TaxID=2617518 RepID=UPI002E12479D|nr:hypothetical protein OIE53_13155 [Micromonospora sp. NBC_01739]